MTPQEQDIIDYHDDGFNDLVIAMVDKKLSTEITSCVSHNHPEGDLVMAWKHLTTKFQPTESSDKVLLKNELYDCKLENRETPEEWITRQESILRRLEVSFGEKYNDEEILALLMKGLPERYKDLRLSFLRQIDSKIDTLTTENLKHRLELI